ncbi:MAG: AI-2E family transporter [Limisphaerales bacterium]|jgi:predicted PurR-regulated permease PerM|nr:MAG: AI-2E family transporter [Limisphaerales bacterium]
MAFPSPSEKQAKVLWFSLTALAIAVFLALLATMFYGVAWVLDRLSPVLLPLAVAGILAFLLNPLVDFFEHKMSAKVSRLFYNIRNPKRVKAIILVFIIAVGIVSTVTLVVLRTVVPDVIQLGKDVQIEQLEEGSRKWVIKHRESSWGKFMQLNKVDVDRIDFQNIIQANSTRLEKLTSNGLADAISLIGMIAGMALVPVYVFYFLLEAQTIQRKWSDYLPLKESKFKEEAVFVLESFNDCLVVFFRGQVLVAICVGLCLAIGFSIIGLPYGILLGLLAGIIGIIPYFGVIVSTVPVLLLSLTHGDQMGLFGNELGAYAPVAALGVCVLVLFLEKTVIQPKIIGDRVGMHPVAVIISVLMGTTLVGGVIGGLLAIPVAMALRAVLFRYVWVKRELPDKAVQMEVL